MCTYSWDTQPAPWLGPASGEGSHDADLDSIVETNNSVLVVGNSHTRAVEAVAKANQQLGQGDETHVFARMDLRSKFMSVPSVSTFKFKVAIYTTPVNQGNLRSVLFSRYFFAIVITHVRFGVDDANTYRKMNEETKPGSSSTTISYWVNSSIQFYVPRKALHLKRHNHWILHVTWVLLPHRYERFRGGRYGPFQVSIVSKRSRVCLSDHRII